MRRLTLVLCAAVVAACDSSSSEPGLDAPPSPVDGNGTCACDAPVRDAGVDGRTIIEPDAPLGTVTGTMIDTHITDSGEVAAPVDLSLTPVAVLIPQGAGWQTHTGLGTASGGFSVSGFPPGPHVLQVGRTFVASSATTLDFGRVLLGRPDATQPVTRATTGFSVDLSGLDSPAATDLVEVYSSNLPELLQHELGAATTITRAYHPVHLVSSAKGDDFFITQLATRRSANDIAYRGLARAFAPAAFSTSEGQITAVPAATMVAPATTITTDLDWRRSEFHALRGQVHPEAAVVSHGLYIYALPGRPKLTSADTPDLFVSALNDQGSDLDYGAVSFGNPFPPAWELVGDERSTFRVSVTATGASTPADVIATVSVVAAAASWNGSPIRPAVTPPRDPTVGGKDGFAPQTGVGLLPIIAWTAPATGTPGAYLVRIDDVTNDAGATALVRAASIFTRDTAVRLPPQTLVAGHRYIATIRAIVAPGVDFAVTPLRQGMPEAGADCVTSPFAP